MSELPYTDSPVCTSEAARAAGLDVPPSPSEMTACAEAIVTAHGGAPTPEVDLARAVPLMAAEVERLRAELAARPTRATVLREGADAIDATFTGPDNDRYARYGADLLRRMAAAAEAGEQS